jgi:hypothetical protein
MRDGNGDGPTAEVWAGLLGKSWFWFGPMAASWTGRSRGPSTGGRARWVEHGGGHGTCT